MRGAKIDGKKEHVGWIGVIRKDMVRCLDSLRFEVCCQRQRGEDHITQTAHSWSRTCAQKMPIQTKIYCDVCRGYHRSYNMGKVRENIKQHPSSILTSSKRNICKYKIYI